MPTPITVMSWNIENFGPTKNTGQNSHIVKSIIGFLVAITNTDILCIQEVSTGSKDAIIAEVAYALNAATGVPWGASYSISGGDGLNETTVTFWRASPNFAVTATPAGAPVIYEPAQVYPPRPVGGGHFEGGPVLGGRKPFVTFFHTTPGGTNFAVSNYHAPPRADLAAVGLGLFRADLLANVVPHVAALFCCGDYNLPYDNAACAGFINAMGALGNLVASNQAPTLYKTLNDLPPIPPDPSGDPNAYIQLDQTIDNIFCTGAAAGAAQRINVAWELRSDARDNGLLSNIVADLDTANRADGSPAFPHVDLSGPPPYRRGIIAYRTFIVGRYVVSDHMPIFVTGIVP